MLANSSNARDESSRSTICVNVRSLSGESLGLFTVPLDFTACEFTQTVCQHVKVDMWQAMLLCGNSVLGGSDTLSSLMASSLEQPEHDITMCIQHGMPASVKEVLADIRRFLRMSAKRVEVKESWMWQTKQKQNRHPMYLPVAQPWSLAQSPRRVSSHKSRQSISRKGHKGLAALAKTAATGKLCMSFDGPMLEKFTSIEECVSTVVCYEQRRYVEKHRQILFQPVRYEERHYIWPKTMHLPSSLAEHIEEHHVSCPGLLLKALHTLRGPALTDLFRRSVKYGGRIDIADGAGMQPLHHAASLGRGELVLFLLEARADATARSRRGLSPLQYALLYFQRTGSCCAGFEDDDEALARACVKMRWSPNATRSSETKWNVFSIRNELSRTATDLAIFCPWQARISKEAVLRNATIPRHAIEDCFEDLWIGWPHAFLRLEGEIGEDFARETYVDRSLVQVRWRLLGNKFSTSPDTKMMPSLTRRMVRRIKYGYSRTSELPFSDSDIDSDSDLDIPLTTAEFLNAPLTTTMTCEDEYYQYKSRTEGPKHFGRHRGRAPRRVKRVACAAPELERQSARVSYSARLARRGGPDGFRKFVQARRFRKGATTDAYWKEEVREAEEIAKAWY